MSPSFQEKHNKTVLPNFFSAVGEIEKACQATASYLLFKPDDSSMLSNKAYYIDKEDADEAWFKPRPEAAAFHKRNVGEQKLFDYIEEGFNLDKEEERSRHIVIEAFDPEVSSCLDNKMFVNGVIFSGQENQRRKRSGSSTN